jgi:hypothetical protein
LSDGQAVPTTYAYPLYMPVSPTFHRPGTWAGRETLITLIEMSDQLSTRHDFNLLEAGLLIRSGVSCDDVSAHPGGKKDRKEGQAKERRTGNARNVADLLDRP